MYVCVYYIHPKNTKPLKSNVCKQHTKYPFVLRFDIYLSRAKLEVLWSEKIIYVILLSKKERNNVTLM